MRSAFRMWLPVPVICLLVFCGGDGGIGPTRNCIVYDVVGFVHDDGRLGPGGLPDIPLPGAVVTIVAGPHAGTSTTTDGAGDFLFTDEFPAETTIDLEARKEGYEPYVHRLQNLSGGKAPNGQCTGVYAAREYFLLGQAPHILWGKVSVAGTNRAIPGARLEVLDGPNAGLFAASDVNGDYRLDIPVTDSEFFVLVSAQGYVSSRRTWWATRNGQFPTSLTPQ